MATILQGKIIAITNEELLGGIDNYKTIKPGQIYYNISESMFMIRVAGDDDLPLGSSVTGLS